MAYRDFVSLVHKSTKRDYLARVTERDKAEVAELALEWGYDYWDGSRQTGYGGYTYDGRWRKVADLYHAGIRLKAAGLRLKHPDWPEQRLLFEARRSLLFAGT